MIKELREKSEKALADFLGRPVKLELFVKITTDWQNDPVFLSRIGLRETK